jgi:hypothetical protein
MLATLLMLTTKKRISVYKYPIYGKYAIRSVCCPDTFDFIYDNIGNPLIVKVSYAYSLGKAYDDCPGYWDKDLNWHEESVYPQRFMIEDFLQR